VANTIDIRDEATPALARFTDAMRREVAPAIGTAVVDLFQQNFRSLPSNAQGFPSSGFWAGAARSTNYLVLADSVVINVDKQGVRQRLQGGTILPTGGKKYLTVARHPESYGKRAREFSNLKFSIVPGYGPALVAQRAVATEIASKRGNKGLKAVASLLGLVVMFQLIRRAFQKPNPKVIPSIFEIGATCIRTANGIADRALKRGGAA